MQTIGLFEDHFGGGADAIQAAIGDAEGFGYFSEPRQSPQEAGDAMTVLLADRGQIRVGAQVATLGCGNGRPAVLLATRFGCRVTGTASSEAGLTAARGRAARRQLDDQARFVLGFPSRTGLRDGEFDRVVALESSRGVSDKGAMIAEAARILKPGGRLLLTDVVAHRPIPTGPAGERERTVKLLRVLLGRARLVTLAKYAAMCIDAGLVVQRVENLGEKTRPTIDAWKARAKEHRKDLLAVLGKTQYREFVDACDAMNGLWRDRVLGYGLVVAEKPWVH